MASRVLFLALVCLAGCGAAQEPTHVRPVTRSHAASPRLFSTQPYERARLAAEKSGKLFIVDATAVWCGPCRAMDKQTWPDAAVTSWFAEHAIAVQLDVDKSRKVAAGLKIQAMPTIIVFKDGREIARTVGYKTPGQLLFWLEQVTGKG